MRQNAVLEVVATDSNHSYYYGFLSFKIFVSKGTFYHVPTTNWKFGAEQNNRIHSSRSEYHAGWADRGKMALDKNFDDIFLSSFSTLLLRKTRGYSFESSLLSKTQITYVWHFANKLAGFKSFCFASQEVYFKLSVSVILISKNRS